MLDLTMPAMDGDAAFNRLKGIDPALKVLLTSGFSSSEVTTRFAGRGLAGFLQKGFPTPISSNKFKPLWPPVRA